jgi:hypothetical protein
MRLSNIFLELLLMSLNGQSRKQSLGYACPQFFRQTTVRGASPLKS